MSQESASSLDPVRSRLRATVATIGKEIDSLALAASGSNPSSTTALTKAFADLVGQLALGPEPAIRHCPACHHIGMREAKICGNCWTKLALLPPLEEGAQEGA